ncbi:3-deoxy-D-manno-octulosonic acid transferase [Bacterioplanes sanyensis]|uniref:3-deoxy-D-manno-octulosonic acid transferase n=1 Tax=Bacterioplanes sanyensis TaxID=1249553 RepID=A0A222FFE7_9GAMM|nr:lipid IV(A) 3-deoxy-D-manno-octulosonic acid transferase [Bacterioplanes sanyensis]ASP37738.1 3-deoxy-D-manno-octulosonic acid transferase [Bacterioplanes sanyensis]
MARFFYTVIYACLLPFMLARLWWRGRVNPGYRLRWRERFGFIPHRPAANGLWVHAVSVGETLAAAPWIKAFQQRHPNVPVIVTTTTPTGSEQVKRLFGDRVYHMFLPYDLPGFCLRFLRQVNPGVLVIMETELWPNLIHSCQQQRVPVVLANARLSEKSQQGYQRFAALTQPMLQQLTMVAVQNAIDGQRFIELGLPSDRLEVTGSVKFDVQVAPQNIASGQQLRQQWGHQRPVLALASSHAGEDEQLLDLYPQLAASCPGLVLMLVPRHPERFDAVANAVHARGLKLQRRSKGTASDMTQVYVADSMGEMLSLLAAADLVVMGGSLIEHGGHNPIEPAALAKATVCGPHFTNFASIVRTLKEAGALHVLPNDQQQWLAHLQQLLAQPQQRLAMGQAGQATVEKNRGAVARLVGMVETLLHR